MCCNGGEIDSNGPLFVAPANEPGLYTWQEAIAACAAKDLGGYTWELPNIDELSDVHAAQSECFTAGVYWSSSDHNGEKAFVLHFNTEYDDTPNAIALDQEETMPSGITTVSKAPMYRTFLLYRKHSLTSTQARLLDYLTSQGILMPKQNTPV